MIARFLNIQGVAGLAASLCLGVLLILQMGQTRHWRKQSGQFEQLYRGEQAAFADTVANYRAAAEQARAADRAAAERVAAEQRAINERTANDYEARVADARARARRLRFEASAAAADPGRGRTAPMSSLSAPNGEPHQTADQDGLSVTDRLTATEQAIQLDELIKWVKRQSEVDPSIDPPAAH
jgi:hypothetical protein